MADLGFSGKYLQLLKVGKFKRESAAKIAKLEKVQVAHVGTNQNYFTFTEDELERAAETLKGTPVYTNVLGAADTDHADNSSMNSIGWTHDVWYDPSDKTLYANSDITHPLVVEKLERVDSTGKREIHFVSMACDCVPICSICGSNFTDCDHERGEVYDGEICTAIGKDIKFKNYVLTNEPADTKAEIGEVVIENATLNKNWKKIKGENMVPAKKPVKENAAQENPYGIPVNEEKKQMASQEDMLSEIHKMVSDLSERVTKIEEMESKEIEQQQINPNRQDLQEAPPYKNKVPEKAEEPKEPKTEMKSGTEETKEEKKEEKSEEKDEEKEEEKSEEKKEEKSLEEVCEVCGKSGDECKCEKVESEDLRPEPFLGPVKRPQDNPHIKTDEEKKTGPVPLMTKGMPKPSEQMTPLNEKTPEYKLATRVSELENKVKEQAQKLAKYEAEKIRKTMKEFASAKNELIKLGYADVAERATKLDELTLALEVAKKNKGSSRLAQYEGTNLLPRYEDSRGAEYAKKETDMGKVKPDYSKQGSVIKALAEAASKK